MVARVTVYESRISGIIKVGSGQRWIKRKSDNICTTAVMFAPLGATGNLKASHRVDQNRNVLGQYQSGFTISANTRYAAWVHGGTGIYGPLGTPIVSPRGKMMKIPGQNPNLPARWSTSRRTMVRSVRGQRANNWLERAARLWV